MQARRSARAPHAQTCPIPICRAELSTVVLLGDQHDCVVPTGTVTLLLSDVERSVRSWEASREGMTQPMARLDELVAAALTLHGGVRPKQQGEGDSFVAA